MKGTPQFPQCGFSGRVVQILDYIGAPVVGVDVLADADIRQGIKEYANWPTVPQLYVNGKFIGGADIGVGRRMFPVRRIGGDADRRGNRGRAEGPGSTCPFSGGFMGEGAA